MKTPVVFAFCAVVAGAGLLSACGGGGTGLSAVSTASPNGSPTVAPTATAAPTATPVPTATPTPSPTPTPPLSVQPGSLSFSAAGQTATITITDKSFSGTFSVVSANASIASVSKISATQYSVQAGSTGGTTTITVSDGTNTAVVPVQLAITSGTIQ